MTEQPKTVAELLSDPARWTQGSLARTAEGKAVASCDPNAVCWCLRGALTKVYGGVKGELMEERVSAFLKRTSLMDWNDDPSRTHAQVVALCRRAGV